MTALYICYQSVLEPLTQTQVIAYLEGLALAGSRIVLLTFEPRPLFKDEIQTCRNQLAAKGIHWHWLRYHKSPTVPATLWDILAGIVVGLGLTYRYRVCLVHARGHVPGLMALALKRLTGTMFLFDVRGFMAEEYVDAGVWPSGGTLFQAVKRVERVLVQAADAIVVLTFKGKGLLERWYPLALARKLVVIIPCCVDFRNVHAATPSADGQHPRSMLEPTLVYAGKLGGWYLTDAMVDFFVVAREFLPNLRFNVWTQSVPVELERLLHDRELSHRVTLGRTTPEALPGKLNMANAALSFIKPCLSKLASSPTKVGEYLAAGLPVVSTAGIGDLDRLLTGEDEHGQPVGVVLRDCSVQAYREAVPKLIQLLSDTQTPDRCRSAADKYFDLERVGWARYRGLYERLLRGGNKH